MISLLPHRAVVKAESSKDRTRIIEDYAALLKLNMHMVQGNSEDKSAVNYSHWAGLVPVSAKKLYRDSLMDQNYSQPILME